MIDAYLPQPGQNWYGYEIIKEIGRGGMGVVYKAVQTNPSREVALKIINTNSLNKQTKRFEREIEVSVQLDHPKIAKLYKFDKINEFIVLVMEYIDGKPLDTFLKERKVSLVDKIHIFMDILKGIEHAHQKNIIHRDIKPDNILVTDKREVKIIDFGIARQVGRKFDLTKTGDILGTPQYMAPEQITGKREYIDQQTDIYALGTVLYEMLVGERMISEGSVMNVFYSIQHEEIISPKQKNIDVATGLQNIWQKAVARSKKRRYQTIDDFVKDIELFLNGGKIKKQLNLKPVWMALICLSILLLFGFIYAVKSKMSIIDIIALEEQKILDKITASEYEEALDIYLDKPEYRYNYLLNKGIAQCCYFLRQQAIDEFNIGNDEKAEEYFQKVLKVLQHDTESLSFLAKIRCRDIIEVNEVKDLINIDHDNEKLEEACKYLEKCIEADPYNSEHFFILGITQLALHEYDYAVTNLCKSIDFDRTNVDAVQILFQIPYHVPELQTECYSKVIYQMLSPSEFGIHVDLHQDVFVAHERKYTSDYFQFLVANQDNNETKFSEELQVLKEEVKNTKLKNRLLYFKYCENFEEEIKKFIDSSSENYYENNFWQELISTSRSQKQEEYEKFCYYQIAYMYNKKNWQQVRKFGETFHRQLHQIIFCEDSVRKNAFITYLAIKAYIESYGFVDLLTNMNQEYVSNINKILLAAVLRSYHIPVKTEIFSLWQDLNYKNNNGLPEKEFIACTIGCCLYNYIYGFMQDTYYRDSQNGKFMTEKEKILLDTFIKSENHKVKASGLMSLYRIMIASNTKKLEITNILLQIKSLLAEVSLEVCIYIHSILWYDTEHLGTNQKEYLNIYFDSINKEQDWRIKQFSILASKNIYNAWRHLPNKITKQNLEKMESYLLQIIKNAAEKKEKENIKLSLYSISILGKFQNKNYVKTKEYLESLSSSTFEKLYGRVISLERVFNGNITPLMANEFLKFWQDAQNETDPYTKSFCIYFFSFMGFHQEITPQIEKEPETLQCVLYSLYRDPNIYIGDTVLHKIPFLGILIPKHTLRQKYRFASQYWTSEDRETKLAALASYIPLIDNEEERDYIFREVQNTIDDKQRKIAALGFRRCVEQEVSKNDQLDIKTIVELNPRQTYMRYLEEYIRLLQAQETNQILTWQKWYHYATKLDRKSSTYLLEKSLLFYYGTKKRKAAEKILDEAIMLEGESNNILHYLRIKLFPDHKYYGESLEKLATQSFLMGDLAGFCMQKKDYSKAINFYEKSILNHPTGLKNHYGVLECLLQLQQQQKAEIFFDIVREIYKRKRINHDSNYIFEKIHLVDHIPEDYPLLSAFARKQ